MFEKLKRELAFGQNIKFITTIVLAVVVAVIIFNLLLFKLVSSYFEQSLLGVLQTSAQGAAGGLDSFMEEKIVALKHIANDNRVSDFLAISEDDTEGYSNSGTELENALNYSLSIDSELSLAWVISDARNSMFLCGEGQVRTVRDMRSRAWYPQILSRVGTDNVWVSQSITGLNDEPTISLVKAVTQNGNTIGYVGFSIYADKVNDIINDMQFADSVYPIIISNDGNIVYESVDAHYKDTFDLPSAVIKQAVNGASAREVGVHKIKTSGGSRYITYFDSKLPEWNYLFCFDTSEIDSRFALFIVSVALLTVLFCSLILVFVYSRIKRTFRDLPNILDVIHRIKEGDYTKKCAVSGESVIGEFAGALDCLEDAIRTREKRIDNFLYTDPLTGLANRKKFYASMESYMKDGRGDIKFAVVYLDIDNFQWVNDTLGHSHGDEYLKQFSFRLSGIVERYGLISRFSADEFVFLVMGSEDANNVGVIIEKIRAVFQAPITVFNDELYVKFSIGVAFYPENDTTPELLIRDADLAMSIAKEHRSRRVVEYYSRSLYTNIANKAFVAKSLLPALEKNELYLNYQPIITTNSRSIHGFEVLLRWNNGEIGNIPPAEFIPVAEETGAIIPIGTWIFESACRFQKAISEEVNYPINMSINVSPQQLLQADYVSNIKMVVEITKIDPKNIQLEITEGVLIDLVETANNVLRELCDIGFTIALDDFGTGYSSLNYLKRFPIKCLKIDKSFIDEIYSSKKDYAITGSIIDLVHSLDITTVAEGVETAGQYDSLSAMKCDLIQGFLFSKPLNEHQAIDFIRKYDELHMPGIRYRKSDI